MERRVLSEGTLIRRSLLGSDAMYRVVRADGDVVEVEVVRAPGLEAGTRLRLLTAKIADDEILGAEQEAPAVNAARHVNRRFA